MKLSELGRMRRSSVVTTAVEPQRLNEMTGEPLFHYDRPVAGFCEDLSVRFMVKIAATTRPVDFRATLGARFGTPSIRRDRDAVASSVAVHPLGGRLSDGSRWFVVTTRYPLGGLLTQVDYRSGEVAELTQDIAAIPGVVQAELDLPCQNDVMPLQSSIPGCTVGKDEAPEDVDWAPRIVGFFDLREGHATGAGVTLGQIDTGYTGHAELNVPQAYDLTAATSTIGPGGGVDPMVEGTSHGTATGTVVTSEAGTSATDYQGQPSDGITGIATGVTLVAVRGLENVVILPFFTQADVAAAVYHCIDEGCNVLTMSFGGYLSSAVTDALEFAYENDVILCAAAGNCVRFVVRPASLATVIACAGIGINPENGSIRPWPGTSRGESVDISAPAENVWVGDWATGSQIVEPSEGTSFATPCVAAAAALWLDHHGTDVLLARYRASGVRLGEVFRQVVQSSATVPPGWDSNEFGAGIVNLPALIAEPLP